MTSYSLGVDRYIDGIEAAFLHLICISNESFVEKTVLLTKLPSEVDDCLYLCSDFTANQ